MRQELCCESEFRGRHALEWVLSTRKWVSTGEIIRIKVRRTLLYMKSQSCGDLYWPCVYYPLSPH